MSHRTISFGQKVFGFSELFTCAYKTGYTPNAKFWDVYREEKANMARAGILPKKVGKDWIVEIEGD